MTNIPYALLWRELKLRGKNDFFVVKETTKFSPPPCLSMHGTSRRAAAGGYKSKRAVPSPQLQNSGEQVLHLSRAVQ